MNEDFLLTSYNYQLPQKLIAQTPAVPRDSSKLLVVDSPISHHHSVFHHLSNWLLPGDLLVFNDTKVIPARLYGHKSTGATVEILLLEEKQPNIWLALVKPGKRFKQGTEIIFDPIIEDRADWQLKAQVIASDPATGGRILKFELPDYATAYPTDRLSLLSVLDRFGEIPLPPYITSQVSSYYSDRYQTVYARQPGAIAAPTAGLHFTDELLQKLNHQGIEQTYVTLHVGVGTFRPVEAETITEHVMHQEWIEVSPETVNKIKATKARGGRIIAVGTTATRALEGATRASKIPGQLEAFSGKTDLFIYPGYQWQAIDGLITNFHLPGSSLLMMVGALIGRKRLLDLYQEAIAHNYRFYSFGDAMLILPEATVNCHAYK